MKKYHKILISLATATIIIVIGTIAFMNIERNRKNHAITALISEYCDSINANDFDRYVATFAKEEREEMLDAVRLEPERKKFYESELSVQQIEQIDIKVAQAACAYNIYNITKDCVVEGIYYVQIYEKFNGREVVDNRAFIIVKEDDLYKIKDLPNVDARLLANFIEIDNWEY